jgi:hypothetical protein
VERFGRKPSEAGATASRGPSITRHAQESTLAGFTPFKTAPPRRVAWLVVAAAEPRRFAPGDIMLRRALPIKAFGAYAILVGALLILAPNLLLATSGFPPTQDVWTRFRDVIATALGYHDWRLGVARARGVPRRSRLRTRVRVRGFLAFAPLGLAASDARGGMGRDGNGNYGIVPLEVFSLSMSGCMSVSVTPE